MNFTRMHNDYLDPDRHINGWSEDEELIVEELTEEEYSQWLKDNKIGEPCPYYPDATDYDDEAYATHLAEREKPAFSWNDDPDYPTCALDYYDNLDADDIYW